MATKASIRRTRSTETAQEPQKPLEATSEPSEDAQAIPEAAQALWSQLRERNPGLPDTAGLGRILEEADVALREQASTPLVPTDSADFISDVCIREIADWHNDGQLQQFLRRVLLAHGLPAALNICDMVGAASINRKCVVAFLRDHLSALDAVAQHEQA